MDDLSLSNPNPNAPDAGSVQPTQPTATPAVAPTTPQSEVNSNAPDADTRAAASIPAALVNNPQVPSQKIATTVDANKTSPAPQHTMLYKAAQELTGGPRYDVSYDANGNKVVSEKPVSPAHLGLALALQVLSGGMAGLSAKGPNRMGEAFEAGQQVSEKARANVQQANQKSEEDAAAAMNQKMKITESNLRLHLLAQQVGASDKAISQTLPDAYQPLTDGLLDGTIALPQGSSLEKAFETDAVASVKNGKTNVTHDIMLPYGDAMPVMENGVQKTLNGVPLWGHMYTTVHGADNLKTTLTKDIQSKLQEIGYFRNADGSPAQFGEPDWSFPDLARKMTELAQVKTGEAMLQQHKNDAHDMLGRDQEDLDDLATAVRTDPAMRKAVATFSRFGGTSSIDEILAGMNKVDPQSAGTLMQYLGLSPKDLATMQNKRLQEQTEAKTKPTAAEKIDSDAKANAVLADPNEAPARKQQAKDFLKGSTATAAGKAAAEASAKTKAEANSGDVQEAARNILSGDLTNLKDITSMRGGQRTAMFNAIHDEAVRQGKDPNQWSPAALKTKADMWEDYRNGKTSNNIAAFDAFLGHANDAMDANDAWRRTGSPLINKPLSWLSKNAENDTNYTAFTTALEPVRKEFMSFLNANRAEHEGDLKTMGTVLSDTSSPAQIETALKQLGKSADIRLAAIGRKYKNTFQSDFPNLISDEGKQTLQRMGITSKTNAATNTAPSQSSRVVPAGAIPGRDASGNIVGYKTADGKVVKF